MGREEDTEDDTEEEENDTQEKDEDTKEEDTDAAMEAAIEAAFKAEVEAEPDTEANSIYPTEAGEDQVENISKYDVKLLKRNVERIKSAFLNECMLCVSFLRERSYVSSYTEDIDDFHRNKNIWEKKRITAYTEIADYNLEIEKNTW